MIASPSAGDGVLVCDGAMGTVLHAAGHPLDQHLPHLNVAAPDAVRAVHDSYLHSGVDIVQTNTFGASRLRLGEAGLAEETERINRAGAEIARRAVTGAGRRVLVAGSVSPAVSVHQRGRVDPRQRPGALREQMGALVAAGVDLLVLETFGYLDELVEAVGVAAELDVPVIAQATFAQDGRMLSGHSAADLVREVPRDLVAALGVNCTLGPQGCLALVRELARHTDTPLTAQPNAGLPRRVGPSRFEYAIDSDYLVRYVRQLLAAGVAVVGGCCGTTPAQIGAVADIVGEHRRARFPASGDRETAAPAPLPERSFLVAAEFVPAVPGDTDDDVRTARTLRGSGVRTVLVSAPRSPRARAGTINLAVHLGDRAGVEAIVSVPTWDRSIMALQADLLGAHALGVRRIVCETGSPPSLGDYPGVDGVWDVEALGLIRLLRGLNDGRDHNGIGLPATVFEIGARVDLGAADLDRVVAQAHTHIGAGADFLITEPVYEIGALERLVSEVDVTRTPVIVCLRPLTSFEEADYLCHEVPDVRIPEASVRELDRAGTHAREVGRRMALDLAGAVAERARGIVVGGAGTSDADFVGRVVDLCRHAVAGRRPDAGPVS